MASRTVQDAWLEYCKINGMDSMNRHLFAIFKAGWNAGLAALTVPNNDQWRLAEPRDLA